ncbi:Filamentous haemagglutinin, N-terminal [Burkholderiaceae bacterium]
MNHCYKVIWNQATATCMAVPETAQGHGAAVTVHPATTRVAAGFAHFFIKPLIAALICMGFSFASHAAPLAAPALNQLPIGAQVSAGAAQVSQSGAVLTVKQSSDKAVLNWQRFDVGSQATVQFEQPSAQSVTLNRVQDSNPSQIFGQIKANGAVFLQNPNGVYFAPGASVDVGSLLATTHSISDADFLNGHYHFNRSGAAGHIINHGQLNSKLGGYIALLAPEVRNLGVVVAKGGSIVLAAGETYRLQFEANDTLTNILVSPATVAAYVENGQAVMAPGGLVILSAQAANAIQGGVVHNSGSIQANGLVNNGGVVRLVASHRIEHTGSVSADAAQNSAGQGGRIDIIASLNNLDSVLHVNGSLSAQGGALGGDGGQIETSGSQVSIGEDTSVATHAPQGTGGSWLIDPTDFTVGTGAGSDISGATLGANLNANNVTILSSSGASGTSGDIHINETVSWSSANKLTLSAANNINIHSAINVPTGGSVALVYGTSVGTGDYNFGSFSANKTEFTGSINFAGTGAGLFTTQLGNNAVDSYTVISNPSTYAASTNATGGINSTSGKFALGQNYNFDRSFTASPITGTFTGKFEGLGHTVGNLTGTGAIGLFSNSSGLIRDVGVNMSASSAATGTGGLVNTNSGVIKNSFANASIYSVTNSAGTALNSNLGGLVGNNSGLVANSFSTGVVSGVGYIGGLIGSNGSSNSASPSNILNSFSKASVTGTGSFVGGLIGQNTTTGTGASSTVTSSFATGDVNASGPNSIGGLIGFNNAAGASSTVAVTDSYATGNVNGNTTNGGNNYYFGGLIGSNTVNASGGIATVTGSHASGNVTAAFSWMGGLIGFNQVNSINGVANILNSYATGTVWNNPSSLTKGTGGLLGLNRSGAAGSSSTVTGSYATGAVSAGQQWTGGLIGQNFANASGVNHAISNSYATGAVSGSTNVGGLVGLNQASNSGTVSVANSYATGSVTGTQGGVGGLLGTNSIDTATSSSGNVTNSYASGNVSNASSSSTGGLIGINTSATSSNSAYISNSYATGTVSSGGDSVGGLVGNNQGYGDARILQSYATGSVTSTSALGNNVGGLVGLVSSGASGNANINQSYATGAVIAAKTLGGLVGVINAGAGSANVEQSYATSTVQQTAASGVAGGLVGQVSLPSNGGYVQISNNFATGHVNGSTGSYLGGLVGKFDAAAKGGMQNNYAMGSVSGSVNSGGLIGALATGSSLQNNYWNSTNNAGLNTTSGGVGGKLVATAGVAALSTTDMQTLSNFSGWDTNSVWQSLSYFNNQLPFLRQNNTLATISLVSGSSVYGDTPVLSYAITNSFGSAITSPTATGTPVWELFSNGASVGIQSISSTTNAGSYSLTYNSGIALGNYTIMSGAASTWTVSKASLGLSVTGTYSGTTSITPTATTVTGLKNGETMVPTAVTLNDANVATANKYVTAITANTGNANFNNYEVASSFNATPNSTSTNTASLNPITLSVTATASLTGNPYKGSAYTGSYTSSAMVAADAALISVSGVATGTDAGTYASNMVVSLSGSAQTNYSNPVITNANLVISPKTITITNTALTADYDGVTSYAALAGQTNYSNTALVGADAMGGVTQTANKTGVAQAGSFSVTPSAASVTSGNPNNYQFSFVAANHTVNPLSISVANAAVNDKVYDGSTTASVASGQVQGVLAMDASNISLTPAGSFTSANAGVNIPVNLSYSLSGTAAGNYVISQPTGLTANITPKNISITGQTGASKVYDATTTASMTGGLLSGVVNTDDVALTQAGTFASANVGTGIAITPNNVLTGSKAANYQLTQPTGLLGDITPAILTVEGLSASNKVYDGTTVATLTGVAVAKPLGGGQVNFNGTPTGFFADKNVGTNKYIDVTGFSLSGADAGNYQVTGLYGVYGDITPATLSVTGLVAGHKVYDGSTAASFSGASFTGLFSGDVVTATTGLFDNKHAGIGKAVSAVLGGADAGNYAATGLTGHTADITPLVVSVTGQVAANKVYDANTSAVLSSGSLNGVLAGDVVTLNQAGQFADKHAGLNKAVVASNTLGGLDAANYAVNQPSYVTANISRATLGLSGLTAADKVYNADTDAVVTGAPVVAALGADSVTLLGTAAGQFNDKNVGVGKTVLLSGLSIDTTTGDGANYVLPTSIGMTASISQRDLTVSNTIVASKVYDATTTASVSGGTLVGVQGADVLVLTQSCSFADKDAGTGKAVTIADSIAGAAKDNYLLIQPSNVTGDITPASLTLSGLTALDKTYDGTTTASLTGIAVAEPLGADQVTVSGVPTAVFASAHAGTAVPVTVANLSLSGADAGNYSVAAITGVSANINPAPLTASVNAFTKVYDGSTQAAPSLVLSGWVGSDSHLAVQAAATLNSKNVLTATQLVVDSVSLSDGVHGELASNYSLSAGQTGVATVTPAPLTASATAPNKVYDGNTSAAPTLAITAGLVAGEQLGVTGTASFNSKDVLTANVVTVDSISLADGTGLASNYSLSAGQTTAAFITPAALTASVTTPNKVYDGTTTATPSLSITAGLVGGEQVGVSGTASFNSKNVLAANLVTVDSVTLSDGMNGELASNYSLSTGQTTAAFITPASLTVTDVAAASAVTGSFKPGAAVLVGVLGADKVIGSVSLDSPDYSSPGFLKVGDYKQAVNTLSGEDAGNYAVAAFTTALANYTVTALPVKAPVAQAVAVAAFTQLPANVTTQRLNDSRANLQPAANPSSSNAKSEVSSATSNTATSNASTNTTTNASSNPQSSATQTSNTLSQGTATASESFGSLNTQTNNANTRSPNLLQASLKVPVRGSTAVAPNLNLVESSLVAGFNELDQDFSLPSPTAPGLPDVFSSAPTTLETNSTEIDDITLDFEERIYAGIREVIQSPLTYQVLTGASSVAFLVKTLLPSWLPSFQVPGSLPNPAPVRVPTSPGAMASGRTSLGRWLGRA